jgi:acetyltransferase-like isoleucine patch superfamily enzyme
LIYWIYYKFKGKHILLHQKTIIKGNDNIETEGILKIGIGDVGFIHKRDTTFLNIRGKMKTNRNVLINRGCRFDIGENALLEIGECSSINPFTKIIIQHGLSIGKDCSISWNCQFLDEDFHAVNYNDKEEISEKQIVIGDRTWIGSNVFIYKGVVIGNDCVIASNSVVKHAFVENNVLIAGNPAKIIKKNIYWQ